jgi:hypothetical protein
MKLRLLLLGDGKIIFEMPLSMRDWPRERLEDELTSFEEEFDMFSRLFDALSHGTRLRMIKRLFEDEDHKIGFGDFMRDLDLNPKIVWESTRKLQDSGFLVKSEDGKYCCSQRGEAQFLMVSLALRRLLQAMEKFEE